MDQQDYIEHIVTRDISNERLRNYVLGKFAFLETNSAVKKAIKNNQIFVNGVIGSTGTLVSKGDLLTFKRPSNLLVNTGLSIDVVYEDDYLMILNKAPGVLSSGNQKVSLQNALKSIDCSQYEGGLLYPLLVHRLDRPTCGLIIAAKTIACRRVIGEMIKQGIIEKYYLLLCEGHIDSSIYSIETPIDGKNARTEVIAVQHLDTKNPISRVEVRLCTGRTHQIRKHFAFIGHPLVGDNMYNIGGLFFRKGLFLMSYKLIFSHPITQKEISFTAPVHKKFRKYIDSE